MPSQPGDNARKKLLELERRRQVAVIREFEKIGQRLSAEIKDLLERIEKERRIDGNASPGLLIRKARLNELLDQVTAEIRDASKRLAEITKTAQTAAIDIAQAQAAAYPQLKNDLNAFDAPATRELIGIAGNGQPLAKHFAGLAGPIRQSMFDSLFYGIAAGKANEAIAREIKDAIGGTTARAMTIVRTETNRAYRESTRKFYSQAPAVIGWKWIAALDLNTCPICWALHGRIFKLKTKFGTHPNCRCTMVPVFAGDPPEETGPQAFAKLNTAQQKTILGPRRLDLYNQGAELSDFVLQKKSVFGVGRQIKPIADTVFKPKPRTPIPPTTARPPRLEPVTPKPASPPATKTPKPKPIKPGSPIPDFKTAAEAAAYMERRYPETAFDYGGMDLKLIQTQAAEMARLLDLYSGVAERLKYVGTYADRSKLLPGDSGRFGKAAYWAQEYDWRVRKQSAIAYNRSVFGDFEGLRAKKKASFARGWHVTDKIYSTTTHEFGHAIESWLDDFGEGHATLFPFSNADGKGDLRTIKDRIIRELKPKYGELSDYGINGRGRTQRAEQWAEGFSMIHNRPAKDWPAFVRAQKILIDLVNEGKVYDARKIPEFRDLPDVEKAKAREKYLELMQKLGLKPR